MLECDQEIMQETQKEIDKFVIRETTVGYLKTDYTKNQKMVV